MRALGRDIRRLAFQLLFQLDARPGADAGELRNWLDSMPGLTEAKRQAALELALSAHADRHEADRALEQLAPDWPPHRQAAVDRALLRLAYHEIRRGVSPPAVAINEAVELAKTFSTDRSPAFINALLDQAYQRLVQAGLLPPPAARERTG